LLVNLLIAMFSRRFESIQKDAHSYWRLQFYRMLMEFRDRPWLPPPFSLVDTLHRLWGGTRPATSASARDAAAARFPPAELEQFQERQTERWGEGEGGRARGGPGPWACAVVCRWYELVFAKQALHDASQGGEPNTEVSLAHLMQMLHAEALRGGTCRHGRCARPG
jgi:hypothetical protein